MNAQQAIELTEIIASSYHQVKFNEQDLEIWISIMLKGDFQRSREKLERHITHEKFPPVISDFLVVIQDKPVEDYSADIEAVQRELNDPVLRKKREEAMKKLREAVKGMNEKVGVSHD